MALMTEHADTASVTTVDAHPSPHEHDTQGTSGTGCPVAHAPGLAQPPLEHQAADSACAEAPALVAYRCADEVPDLVPGEPLRNWMRVEADGAAVRCLPMLMANQSGWVIPNPRRFIAVWSGEAGPEAIRVGLTGPMPGVEVRSFLGSGILTFQFPLLFRTAPGYNLLVRGPANWPKDGIAPLEGLVETDWAESTFLMSWKITRPRAPIVFDTGEPLCMLVPQRRGELESFQPRLRPLSDDPALADGLLQWTRGRMAFKQAMAVPGSPEAQAGWQKDYVRGRTVSGQTAPEHQTRLRLQPFVERD